MHVRPIQRSLNEKLFESSPSCVNQPNSPAPTGLGWAGLHQVYTKQGKGLLSGDIILRNDFKTRWDGPAPASGAVRPPKCRLLEAPRGRAQYASRTRTRIARHARRAAGPKSTKPSLSTRMDPQTAQSNLPGSSRRRNSNLKTNHGQSRGQALRDPAVPEKDSHDRRPGPGELARSQL
jgi:hypothetical protein